MVSLISPTELRPSRIEALAKQPVADWVISVGLATSLAAVAQDPRLHCAGLFYARLVSHDDKQVVVDVAALPHRLESNSKRLNLTKAEFAQLLEYDRRMQGLATCDVRELVEEHVRELLCNHQVSLQILPEQNLVSDVPPVPERQQKVHVDAAEVEPEPEVLFLPLHEIQQLGEQYRLSRPELARLLVRCALARIARQRDEARFFLALGRHSGQQRARMAELRQQQQRLVRALKQRGPVSIELLPIYAHGQREQIVSCRLEVDIPVAA